MKLLKRLPEAAFAVFLIYFFLGFAAIVVQSILIREFLVVADGNELVIGTLFSFWFFWIALGAWCCSVFLKKVNHVDFIFWILIFSGLILLPVQVVVIRLIRSIFSITIGTNLSFGEVCLSSILVFAPFSFIIGMTFPLGSRLFQNVFKEKMKVIGAIYWFEAVGSLAGGLVFTFLFLKFYTPFQVSIYLLLFAMLLFLLYLGRFNMSRALNILFPAVLILGIIMTLSARFLQEWSEQERWGSIAGDKNTLLSSLDTPYDHVSISRFGEQYSIFQNGQLSFVYPQPFLATVHSNLILLQHPKPEQILGIGSGFGVLLKPLLQHSDLRMDWVIRDRKLFAQLQPIYAEAVRTDNGRLNIFFKDGRDFIRSVKHKYDLVYLALPPPSTAAANRFYTLEFFRLVRQAMKDDGVLVFRLSLSENYLREDVLQFAVSIHRTLRVVFPDVEITSGENNFFIAANHLGIIPADFETVRTRWESRIPKGEFSIYSLLPFYDPDHLAFLKNKIQHFQNRGLNSDLKPVSYLYHLILWNMVSGDDPLLTALWNTFGRLKFSTMLIFLMALLILRSGWIVYKVKSSRQILSWNCQAGVFIAGFTAIGLEILLIFGYQNIFGSLYQNIALLTAVFMSGLALGAVLVNSRVSRISNIKHAFILFELLAILFVASVSPLLKLIDRQLPEFLNVALLQVIYLILVLFAGALTGVLFPVAAKGLLVRNKKINEAAGSVDAWDHAGACVGAMLVGTFLIPSLGFTGTALFLAALNAFLIVTWLIDPK